MAREHEADSELAIITYCYFKLLWPHSSAVLIHYGGIELTIY